MLISKIEIENFRSIEEESIEIKKISNKNCFILLGINESGKSNILNAIALLDKDKLEEITYSSDCNKNAETKKESIKITYHLIIDNINFYKKKFIEKGYPKEIIDNIEITDIQRIIEVDKDNDKTNYLHIWVKEQKVFKDYIIHEKEIKKLKDVYSGEEKIDKDNIVSLLGEGYKLFTARNFESLIEDEFFSIFEHNIPKIIFWEYDSRYLINESVDLNAFKADTSLSIPLRNIFYIAGIREDDISDRIELIVGSKEKRKQLEEELSTAITSHINKKWSEHDINIEVDIEDMKCSIMVEDKDNTVPKYSMLQRSDGFRQFVSILLNISAENSSNVLKNNIIILDEPEIHLHPSGIRYLRDELLDISNNNIVIIATHSIYMVDKNNLERHYKIEKEKSKTNIIPIEDNPYMEEVVYESLGTSIYELIEPNMIIFEGKTDKDVFDCFTKKYKKDIKPKRIGTLSADSVDKIPKYTKFFNKKLVKGYVVVDSDPAGVAMKKNILNEKNFNKQNTFEINDMQKTGIEATLEDLFPKEMIKNVIKEEYKIEIDLDFSKPIIKQLEKKNKDLKGKINIDVFKGRVVNLILKDVSKFKKEDCKKKYSKYYKFVENLHKKIK